MDTKVRLHHVPAGSGSSATGQTPGMRRVAAISSQTVGSSAIFMGQTHVAPGTSSGPHHHGRSETGIYVVSGHPVFVYRDGQEQVRLETSPGDYVYVPPFVPHIEENPSSQEEAVVVVARSTQEAIVENLDGL
ncbi:MAG: cupin domain-containing protein [Actinomycetota bacterium]